MKISGFTIIRNAVKNDYPVVEAITSVLPVVDEMIVSIGDCDDETEQLIQSIQSDKIRIIHSVWDSSKREGGKILAIETNKAFQHIAADSDWAFYIQADEVLHEKYYGEIRAAGEKYLHDNRIEGLLFHYLHFYGTYSYTCDSRKWYDKEVRLIRNNKKIQSYKDAQGFRRNGQKLKVKLIDAFIYHYGWVKDPYKMKQKIYHTGKFWHTDEVMDAFFRQHDFFDFTNFDSIKQFTGTHPTVMQKRIIEKDWKLELDPSRKKFSVKDRFLHWVSMKTGKRFFVMRNYKIV